MKSFQFRVTGSYYEKKGEQEPRLGSSHVAYISFITIFIESAINEIADCPSILCFKCEKGKHVLALHLQCVPEFIER